MNPNIEKLLQLQEIDTKIHELDLSQEQFPEQVETMEGAIAQAESTIEQLKARIAEIGEEKSTLEGTMEESRQAVERSQTRLTTIRTNREYDALHSEIETNEGSISSGKSRLASLEDERGRVEETIAEAEKGLDELKSEDEPKIAELKGKIAAIDGQKSEHFVQRKVVEEQLSGQFLRAYEHILKRRKTGKALSFASTDSRTCSMCHKVLEPQVVNEIRAAKRLNICQSCGSILIWLEEKPEQEETAPAE